MEEIKNKTLSPSDGDHHLKEELLATISENQESEANDNQKKELEFSKSNDKQIDDTEYAKAKEYISIIMHELEDTKEKLALFTINEKKRKFNAWKGIAIFELLCLLSAGTILSIRYIQENYKSNPVVNQGSGVYNESEIISQEKTYYYIENLSEMISEMNSQTNTSFQISVERLFGYEYLCFSNGDMKVYYRNEFTNNQYDDRFRILLDNGQKLVEFNWEYDLGGNIKNLCPILGKFSEDEGTQLTFLFYPAKNSNIPTKITMVDTKNFTEYTSLDVIDYMKSLFHLSYVEEASNNITSARMDMHIKSATYSYKIKNEDYLEAVYNDQFILNFNDYSSMEVFEDKLSINVPVYISSEAFLGEIAGNIKLKNGAVIIENITYGAYVEPSQEDPGKSDVIIPRSTMLHDRVIILGKDNRRYLIEKFANVEKNTMNWENLVDEGNYKVYYENGVKESIMGIDVSKYQGKIDWNKVKEAGVEYAIIRLGFRGMNEGTLELDPLYVDHIEGAKKVGIPVGVYFFSQAITVEEAIEEANMVLNNITEYDITYPIVFDTEYITFYNARANNITRANRTDITIAFCETIKNAGYKPMIYSNTKGMIMHIDLTRLTAYDKWFAYYGNKIAFPYQFQMLQYSDTGMVPGIEGNVDLNISFIDYSVE